MIQKRAAAIHDISCFGKCSLTVALPVISAAGIEVCPVPTSLLSTHTGGFSGIHTRDLTDDIMPVARHWKSLGLRFDALYSGYLGSYRQLEIVKELFGLLAGEDTVIIVDPVMADHGRLYGGFDGGFPGGMAQLCAAADIITPNITEAVFMLGESYREGPYEREYIEDLAARLYRKIYSGRKGPGGTVVLTGVYYDKTKLGAASYGADGSFREVFADWVDGSCHGTGDIFCSVLTAGILSGLDLTGSMKAAAEYVSDCVKLTKEQYGYMTYGVNFESGLAGLAARLRRG